MLCIQKKREMSCFHFCCLWLFLLWSFAVLYLVALVIRFTAREQVAGFVSGRKHMPGFYKEFILRNFISAGVILLPKIFSLTTMKNILETLLHPAKKGKKSKSDVESFIEFETMRSTPNV